MVWPHVDTFSGDVALLAWPSRKHKLQNSHGGAPPSAAAAPPWSPPPCPRPTSAMRAAGGSRKRLSRSKVRQR